MSKKDGFKYRLPIEEEWQAAAAGKEGRKYPWGNTWDKTRCNIDETGIIRTSPVGVFKKGGTIEGVFDLSGNVWEWTDSWLHNEEGLKVLRGSSWNFDHSYVRCADRYWTILGGSGDSLGFRCARTK